MLPDPVKYSEDSIDYQIYADWLEDTGKNPSPYRRLAKAFRDPPEEIREAWYGIQILIEEERKRHEQRISELRGVLKKIQKICPHTKTNYHPDASGNNDSFTECADCKKEL